MYKTQVTETDKDQKNGQGRPHKCKAKHGKNHNLYM